MSCNQREQLEYQYVQIIKKQVLMVSNLIFFLNNDLHQISAIPFNYPCACYLELCSFSFFDNVLHQISKSINEQFPHKYKKNSQSIYQKHKIILVLLVIPFSAHHLLKLLSGQLSVTIFVVAFKNRCYLQICRYLISQTHRKVSIHTCFSVSFEVVLSISLLLTNPSLFLETCQV